MVGGYNMFTRTEDGWQAHQLALRCAALMSSPVTDSLAIDRFVCSSQRSDRCSGGQERVVWYCPYAYETRRRRKTGFVFRDHSSIVGFERLALHPDYTLSDPGMTMMYTDCGPHTDHADCSYFWAQRVSESSGVENLGPFPQPK